MATATANLTRLIGPDDHGQPATLEEFIEAEFVEGFLYELSRGVIDVAEVPGPNHGRTVRKVARLFILYDEAHPGVINYGRGAGNAGSGCRAWSATGTLTRRSI